MDILKQLISASLDRSNSLIGQFSIVLVLIQSLHRFSLANWVWPHSGELEVVASWTLTHCVPILKALSGTQTLAEVNRRVASAIRFIKDRLPHRLVVLLVVQRAHLPPWDLAPLAESSVVNRLLSPVMFCRLQATLIISLLFPNRIPLLGLEAP